MRIYAVNPVWKYWVQLMTTDWRPFRWIMLLLCHTSKHLEGCMLLMCPYVVFKTFFTLYLHRLVRNWIIRSVVATSCDQMTKHRGELLFLYSTLASGCFNHQHVIFWLKAQKTIPLWVFLYTCIQPNLHPHLESIHQHTWQFCGTQSHGRDKEGGW